MTETAAANILPFDRQTPAFERRRYPRLSAPEIHSRPGGKKLEILDMSLRGMAIRTGHPFSVGGIYLFELVDAGKSLMVEGRICWSRRVTPPGVAPEIDTAPEFCTGIAFVGIQNRSPDSETQASETELQVPTSAPEEDEQLTADRIARLQRSDNTEESAELLLELLSGDFEHLLLFRLKGEEIRAWLGRGPTLIPDRLRRLRLPLERASVFLHLQQGGSFFYGMLPTMFAHLQLLRCWDGELERECVLFPIRLGSRLVAVLYADCGEQALTPEHLGSLKAATELFTNSLVDQILRRKSRAAETTD